MCIDYLNDPIIINPWKTYYKPNLHNFRAGGCQVNGLDSVVGDTHADALAALRGLQPGAQLDHQSHRPLKPREDGKLVVVVAVVVNVVTVHFPVAFTGFVLI